MADDLATVWRNALEANLRYYEAWGRVANEYLRDLGESLGGYSPTIRVPSFSVPVSVGRSDERSEPEGAPATQPPTPPARPSLVLEGEGGASATGAVLVQNHLSHPVSTAVVARLDDGDDGELDDLAVELDPAHVELAPGESAVVRVSVTVPANGRTDRRGELSVPELVGTSVPLLVRRRASADPAR
jgi:hypothetical protein